MCVHVIMAEPPTRLSRGLLHESVSWLVAGAWPNLDSLSPRLVIGAAVSLGFTAALGVALRTQ
ncbi:hypothetical protein [Dactylosporangium sp. CA-139066]|uniref:hypothetical protein n=1 Tax=Dactylosporangium sp. CA-139066 TaxID=3239930 RepID=UPI003D8CA49C